ncbi:MULTISPECIES: diaminopimelate dehydrogenase [Sporosarcina]|uniref:Meso-diaminopimelate D-dehydrogenase n=2 Tax=Sporosarcina newyorkensis TaxID=759851 RepID=A0A1T4XQR1_9BACL|nr:diaminopimelate dehydrogenase [Sporosarcina newyorkensis]EGQ22423.1 diaminopimelate dehydrogenase [Sporosarcina newyorkensis 2681]SKA91425.1 diaminopimelate dehydrogenase [Sporosarcina newyorkensis]
MNNKIRVGIAGYGNLGRGVESAISQNEDMTLVGVFTRREPVDVQLLSDQVPVHKLDEIESFKDDIDVLILCGGSKNDLPEQGPALAKHFTTVDSYDTHAKIPEYFASVDEVAQAAGTTAIISVGWDPGLFSINRMMGEAILPEGETYTFWGKGLSQGHSDAVRRVDGVKAGVQYTLPAEDAMNRVRNGELPELSTKEKHTRECYVVLEEGASEEQVRETIVTMPDYFADYNTTVNFITEEELRRDHAKMPHGGFVIRSGKTGESTDQVIEFSLKLDSNPEFTSSVLVAYARAAHKLQQKGDTGAKTVYDIAPGLLSPKSPAEIRKELL